MQIHGKVQVQNKLKARKIRAMMRLMIQMLWNRGILCQIRVHFRMVLRCWIYMKLKIDTSVKVGSDTGHVMHYDNSDILEGAYVETLKVYNSV
jgi:hypothetical protein